MANTNAFTPVDVQQHYSKKESKQVPNTDAKHFLASSGKDMYAMQLAKFHCALKLCSFHVTKFIPLTYTDLTIFTRVTNSPFTEQILQEKSFNIPTSQEFTCSNTTKFKWTAILTKIKEYFQMLCLVHMSAKQV